MATIPNTRPYFPAPMTKQITEDIAGILTSGRLMMGPFRDRAETAFATSTGTRHAVSLNSATTGLQISLRYSNCKNREVLVPAASFLTDLGAVLMEGGIPVLVDCDPETMALDVNDVRQKISSKTAAIIWVHLTGYISDQYSELQDIARQNDILLIEDSSHAHGAEIDGHRAGALGNVGVFSMYPTKVLTSGTGGFLTTNDDDLAKFARQLRMFGKEEETGEILHLGNDWFLDEIRACVAAHQAEALPTITALRRAAAERYNDRLSNRANIRTFRPRPGHSPGWYQFPILFKDGDTADVALETLKHAGIGCKKIYRPLHQERIFSGLPASNIGNAEDLLNRAVCLPFMTDITTDEIDAVCDAIIEFSDSLLP